jgi:hypothetical protein
LGFITLLPGIFGAVLGGFGAGGGGVNRLIGRDLVEPDFGIVLAPRAENKIWGSMGLHDAKNGGIARC